MQAREVMTTPVVTASPGMTVKDAADLMAQHRVSGLPVVDAEGRLVGLVSESDLLARLEYGTQTPAAGLLGLLDRVAQAVGVDRRFLARTVGELMTTAVTTAGPEATLRELSHLMNTYHINRIPILEDGRPIGIVSRADVIRAMTRPDAAITEEVRWRLEHDLWIDLKDIEITTTHGVVTLTGEVENRADAELAARWAGATDGVVAVESTGLRYRIDDRAVKNLTDRLR